MTAPPAVSVERRGVQCLAAAAEELDSGFDTKALYSWLPSQLRGSCGIGWRLRALVALALAGCVALFMITRSLAAEPWFDAQWRANAQGQLELAASDDPALAPLIGRAPLGAVGEDGRVAVLDALLLQRSPRWMLGDTERARHRDLHAQLHAVLAQPTVRLHFSDGSSADLAPKARGSLHLGLPYWLLSALALVLYLVGLVVVMVRPTLANALYAAMALCQSGSLLFIAATTALDLAMPPGYALLEWRARTAFDLATAAAMVSAACVHPRRLPHAAVIALAAWVSVGTLFVLAWNGSTGHAWWWTQASIALLGLVALALLGWSYRIEPNPYARVMRRFGMVTVGSWVLLSVAIAATEGQPGLHLSIATTGPISWVVFVAWLVLLMPFLAKSQHVLREFSLLAGISTVATSLDLLFVAAFSFGQLTSITLSVFLSLGLYAGARQWVLNHLRGSHLVTMERLFERLYRMAREVEAQPQRAASSLLGLLQEVFEPLESALAQGGARLARTSADGSTLTVPVPDLSGAPGRTPQTLVLRFAQRGRQLFTDDDARLANRVVEQLRRAIVFDQAVERGRSEERSRLAQDLHDDIGARLLTLMYQAQSPEHEDYIRHTLQDLKTLTRGLAAHNHPLSHAAGEWKADLQQRLELANASLAWRVSLESEVDLSVVQWSALTRVLRELVSNVIAHAHATEVSIAIELRDDRLLLHVRDNGCGRNPPAWSHGLGLGGVRKRVKQLSGEVEWLEVEPTGIECRVEFGRWSGVSVG